MHVPARPRLKARRDFKLVGTSPPPLDIPAKLKAAAQVEGAIVMGLSAAIGEQIRLAAGAVVSAIFRTIRS